MVGETIPTPGDYPLLPWFFLLKPPRVSGVPVLWLLMCGSQSPAPSLP